MKMIWFETKKILPFFWVFFFMLQSAAVAGSESYKHLLLIYPNTDADYVYTDPVSGVTEKRHYTGSMSDELKTAIVSSFKNLPFLTENGSAGVVSTTYEIIEISVSVTKLTSLGGNYYMLCDWDIHSDLELYAPKCRYDSVSVVWNNGPISANWGMGGAFINNGTTTFSSIIAGQKWWWGNSNNPDGEQVFLHEWLHAVCRFYEQLGYPMPVGDADGASSHGYTRDATEGWMPYYRDLMQGKVWESRLSPPQYTGVTAAAWTSKTPKCTIAPLLIVNNDSGTGIGTVTSSDGSINCGNTCSASYDAHITVNLTAVPDSGSSFSGWSGACTGKGACLVKMDMPFSGFEDDFSTDTGKWTYAGGYRDDVSHYVALTKADTDAAGVIWLNEEIKTDAETTVEFSYMSGGGTGADGFVMMFYIDMSYAPWPKSGGSLGFEGWWPDSYPYSGYGIEFDSYKNESDRSAQHIALIKDNVQPTLHQLTTQE